MNLYELLQSRQSSSSGTGSTYYGVAATCGMKARLQEAFPFAEPQGDGTAVTPTGKRQVDGRRAGAFYHALQEMWRLEQMPDGVVSSTDHYDYDYEVALNSYTKYVEYWKGNRHNLGQVHSAEVRIPEATITGGLTPRGERQMDKILAFTGGIPFTMRYDLRTDISIDDLGRIAVERELALPGVGPYLVDYKLVASINDNTMWEYSYSFQQLAYPVIYNLVTEDEPVRGMLVDVMARVINPEARHFALYLAYTDEQAKEIVRHGIVAAHEASYFGQANPFQCIGKYRPCHFLKAGICPRHGAYEDFDFSSGKGVLRAA